MKVGAAFLFVCLLIAGTRAARIQRAVQPGIVAVKGGDGYGGGGGYEAKEEKDDDSKDDSSDNDDDSSSSSSEGDKHKDKSKDKSKDKDKSHHHDDDKCKDKNKDKDKCRPDDSCPVKEHAKEIKLFVANGAISTQGIIAFFLKLGQKNPSYICDCNSGSLQFFEPFKLSDVGINVGARRKRNATELLEFLFPVKAFSYSFNSDTCEDVCLRDESGNFWVTSFKDPNNLDNPILGDVDVDIALQPAEADAERRAKRGSKKNKNKKKKKLADKEKFELPKSTKQQQQDAQSAALNDYVQTRGGALKFIEGYLYPYCVTENDCHQFLVLTPFSGKLAGRDKDGKFLELFDNSCLYKTLEGLKVDVGVGVNITAPAGAGARASAGDSSAFDATAALTQTQAIFALLAQNPDIFNGKCKVLAISAISCNGCGPIKGNKIDKCFKQED